MKQKFLRKMSSLITVVYIIATVLALQVLQGYGLCSSSYEVVYTYTAEEGNLIYWFNILNNGTVNYDLKGLKIRHWFNRNGASLSDLRYDYVGIKINGVFGTDTTSRKGDTYFEMTVSDTSMLLAPNKSTKELLGADYKLWLHCTKGKALEQGNSVSTHSECHRDGDSRHSKTWDSICDTDEDCDCHCNCECDCHDNCDCDSHENCECDCNCDENCDCGCHDNWDCDCNCECECHDNCDCDSHENCEFDCNCDENYDCECHDNWDCDCNDDNDSDNNNDCDEDSNDDNSESEDVYNIKNDAGIVVVNDSNGKGIVNNGTINNTYTVNNNSTIINAVTPAPTATPIPTQKPTATPTPTRIPGGISLDLGISLSADKTKYMVDQEITYTIDYKNKNNVETGYVVIAAEIPQYTVLSDNGGGTVSGKVISWKINSIQPFGFGKIVYKVKVTLLPVSETFALNTARFFLTEDILENTADDTSTIKVLLYNNDLGEHKYYIVGYPDKLFKPDNSITRAEVATIFSRISGVYEPARAGGVFKDVPQSHWASGFIKSACVDLNLFTGYPDGTIKPDKAVTRAEVAAVATKYMQMNPVDPIALHFNDVENSWAKNFIEDAYRNKLTMGYLDSTFRPNEPIKRSEFVTMINKMLFRGPLVIATPTFPDVTQNHWAYGQVEEASIFHKYRRDINGNEINN